MSTSPDTLSSDLPCLVLPQASSRSSAVLREGKGLTKQGVSSGLDHRVYGTDLSALNGRETPYRLPEQPSRGRGRLPHCPGLSDPRPTSGPAQSRGAGLLHSTNSEPIPGGRPRCGRQLISLWSPPVTPTHGDGGAHSLLPMLLGRQLASVVPQRPPGPARPLLLLPHL